MQTRLFFSLYLGQGHQNLINSFNYPNDKIQSLARIHHLVRVDKLSFLSKFDIQNASVTLKMRSRSPKSNHFFLMSQWCFCASLVKIHQLIQEIECRQGSFLVFVVW